jgi:hypothetical protein
MITRTYTIDEAALRTEFPRLPGLASDRMNYLLALAGCPLRVVSDETVAQTMIRVMSWILIAFPEEAQRFIADRFDGTFAEALSLLDMDSSGVKAIRRKSWPEHRTMRRDAARADRPLAIYVAGIQSHLYPVIVADLGASDWELEHTR